MQLEFYSALFSLPVGRGVRLDRKQAVKRRLGFRLRLANVRESWGRMLERECKGREERPGWVCKGLTSAVSI